MPQSPKKPKTKPGDSATAKTGSGDKARASRGAALSSALSGAFSAPAGIMGPRLLFIGCVAVLCMLGLVMVYSSSSILAYSETHNPSAYLERQLLFMVVGIALCVVLAKVPYRIWRSSGVCVALCVIAFLTLALCKLKGVSALGAERSISLGPFALQPSEFAKIAVMLVFVSLVSRLMNAEITLGRFAASALFAVLVPIILIILQPDLGTTSILVAGLLAVCILAGVPVPFIFGVLGLFAFVFVIICFAQPYHLDRFAALLDPWSDPLGNGHQTIQSFYAFGSGGIFGSGISTSRQKYLYLSEAHTDFIFSILGEELGLVGTCSTVALYVLFAFAGLRIARTAPDKYGSLVAGGLSVMLCVQAFVNMAQACGVIPVTGKALPFITYGGSSLLASFIIVGLVLSVSLHSKLGAANERRRDSLLILSGGKRDAGAGSSKARIGAFGHGISVLQGGKRAGTLSHRGADRADAPSSKASGSSGKAKPRASDGRAHGSRSSAARRASRSSHSYSAETRSLPKDRQSSSSGRSSSSRRASFRPSSAHGPSRAGSAHGGAGQGSAGRGRGTARRSNHGAPSADGSRSSGKGPKTPRNGSPSGTRRR